MPRNERYFGAFGGFGYGWACMLLWWIHLLATGLYVGTTAGLPIFTIPSAARIAEPAARRSRLVRVLRVYDPLAIALLGIIVMTGAWSVTDYKQALGGDYYARFGGHLATKLMLAFLAVMSGTYVCFGLGHRLVREEDWEEEVDEPRLASMTKRLGAASWLTVALTLAAAVVATTR